MTRFTADGLASTGQPTGYKFSPEDRVALAEADDWLAGVPMDPAAQPAEPVPPLAGWPFLPDAGAAVIIVGPTGGGRSSLVHACLYDATADGIPAMYLGHEVVEVEFQARTAAIAEKRGDEVTDVLRQRLSRVRYLELSSTISRAWADPASWRAGIIGRYRVIVIDPLSAVETALGLDFQGGGGDYSRFHDRLIQPLVVAGVIVVALDNVGHAIEAKGRARGDSAKTDRVDLAFACTTVADPPGLRIKATKVRSTRAGIRRDDAWTIDRETQRITRATTTDTATGGQQFRPTTLMDKAAKVIADSPGLNRQAVLALVGGNSKYANAALSLLVAEGFVRAEKSGREVLHTTVKSFTPDQVPTRFRPASGNLVQGEERGSAAKPPLRGFAGTSSAAGADSGINGEPGSGWTEERAEQIIDQEHNA